MRTIDRKMKDIIKVNKDFNYFSLVKKKTFTKTKGQVLSSKRGFLAHHRI